MLLPVFVSAALGNQCVFSVFLVLSGRNHGCVQLVACIPSWQRREGTGFWCLYKGRCWAVPRSGSSCGNSPGKAPALAWPAGASPWPSFCEPQPSSPSLPPGHLEKSVQLCCSELGMEVQQSHPKGNHAWQSWLCVQHWESFLTFYSRNCCLTIRV